MDLLHIPKVFWYSISTSIFLIASTFSWAAYNAKGMTVEIANAKIAIYSQLSDIDKINNQLLSQSKKLDKFKKTLEIKLKTLKKSQPNKTLRTKEWKSFINSTNKEMKFENISNDVFIKNINTINNLKKSILIRKDIE